MRSSTCKIENGTNDLEAILKECEKVAAYCGLTEKQCLHLRLLCEEIDGMLPHIIDEFSGDFWIDMNDCICKVNASIVIPEISSSKKEELIAVARNKKNSAAVGIVGKIRDAIENLLLISKENDSHYPTPLVLDFGTGYCDGVDYSYLWSLEQYRSTVNNAEKTEEWDELEKSVIASVADDVIVGVKGNRANIVIVKKFA